ncbi:MAG: hypothetical protein R3F65_30845 [bacterium]
MAPLDHALVGNGRLLVLVAPGGGVDYAVMPRFDGPPLCSGDGDGHIGVTPVADVIDRQVRYHPSSNATRAVLTTDAGRVAIDDLGLPPPDPRPEWVRIVRPLDGPIALRFSFAPRLGAATPRLTGAGVEIGSLTLRVGPVDRLPPAAVLRGEPVVLDAPVVLVLADGEPATPAELPAAEAALDAALAAGRARVDRLPLALPPLAHRAYSCLLQHIYAHSGLISAGVVSTDAADRPRRLWLRTAADAADALLSLGQPEPALALLGGLREAAIDGALRPDYAIDPRHPQTGDVTTSPERAGRVVTLAHRIHSVTGARPSARSYAWIAELVEQIADLRGRPDRGPWDGPPGAWTTSHLWSWATFERGARLARLAGETPRAERWAALAASEATLIRQAIDDVGLVAATLHDRRLDPAVCVAQRLGFVAPDEPAWLRTLDALHQSARDGLVPTPVDSRPLAATLWTAEALARAGWSKRARALYDAVARRANPAGLFAERVDDDDRPAGRFPSVAVHAAALRAALALRG